MNREKELAKNTVIITIGRLSTQFVSFLLLPLYTAVLSTSEYGTVDFVTTLVQFLIPIVSLMIDQGVFRFLLASEDILTTKKIITGAVLFQSLLNAISLLIGIVIYCFTHNQYIIWLFLILTATSYSNLILQTARGIKKTTDYALGSFICSSITIVLNVLFIVGLKFGAVGMLLASFIGNLFASVFMFSKLKLYKFISFRDFSKGQIQSLLQYSIPLVPNQLSIWTMNSSDRLIVTFILGASANGILAISHKFPAIFMTFFNIFLLAWHETGALHFYDEDKDDFFSNIINELIIFFSTFCIGILLVLPLCFEWLVSEEYLEAYFTIPIYMLASMINVMIGLLGVIYVATKKTGEIAKTTIIAAIFNVLVHLILINSFELYAAAVSTLIGYFVALVYRVKDAKKYINISYNLKIYAILLIIFLVVCYLYYFKNMLISAIFLIMFIPFAFILNKDMIHQIFPRRK